MNNILSKTLTNNKGGIKLQEAYNYINNIEVINLYKDIKNLNKILNLNLGYEKFQEELREDYGVDIDDDSDTLILHNYREALISYVDNEFEVGVE